jgi:hypothetical protein
VIDFYATGSDSGNLNAYTVRTGPDSDVRLEMDGNLGPLLRVQGEVTAQVGDFLSLNGAISFEQSTKVLTLNETADEVQRLSIEASSRTQPALDPTKAAGYRLSLVVDGKTYTTANLSRDASAQSVQDALNTALQGTGGAMSVEHSATSLAQSEAIQLTGNYTVGDKIVLSGLATKDLTYTVTSKDLQLNTQGKSGNELAAQVRNNIAAKVRAMVNGAGGGKVYAYGDADIITLVARSAGTAGAFALNVSVMKNNVTNAAVDMLSQRASATGSALAQRELLLLSGDFAVGDEVVLSGVADEDVVYTLVAEDFTRFGNGRGGVVSGYWVAHNVAEKLKLALADAEGALATAQVEGAFIKFTAVKGGMAGAFELSVSLPESASMFLSQAARDDFDIRFTDGFAGKDQPALTVIAASKTGAAASWLQAKASVIEQEQGGVAIAVGDAAELGRGMRMDLIGLGEAGCARGRCRGGLTRRWAG